LKNKKATYHVQKQKAKKEILKYYHRYNGVLGHRMMKIFLAKKKIYLSKITVHKYMKELNLQSVVMRKRPPYIRGKTHKVFENLLNGNFYTSRPKIAIIKKLDRSVTKKFDQYTQQYLVFFLSTEKILFNWFGWLLCLLYFIFSCIRFGHWQQDLGYKFKVTGAFFKNEKLVLMEKHAYLFVLIILFLGLLFMTVKITSIYI